MFRPLDEVAELRHHWQGAYRISNPAPDVYLAVRTDDGTQLTAATPQKLREKIRADYAERPVPR